MTPEIPTEGAPPKPVLQEVRYSLPELLAELKSERASGTFATEKIDQSEIVRMFKPPPPRRAKPKK
jgi:hypothetical protein